jgi:DNA (cytosine-5)-methyltransferase 1
VRIGSLFSGIGGLELGLERAGVGSVTWQVEINDYCRKVLARHWPNVTRHKDIKEVGKHNLTAVNLICGGFPCQDVSVAGKGAGLSGERSGLWFEFLRVIQQLQPSWVVIENVSGGKRRWLPTVRHNLQDAGYQSTAIQISAFNVGAPHKRERVFVLATNSNRVDLWQQPGRQEWQNWEDRAKTWPDGKEGVVANSRQSRLAKWKEQPAQQELQATERSDPWATGDSSSPRELQPQGRQQDQWRWSVHPSGWAIESPVCGVGYGIPNRMDRIKALGNAVVPQCSEAVGKYLKSLISD